MNVVCCSQGAWHHFSARVREQLNVNAKTHGKRLTLVCGCKPDRALNSGWRGTAGSAGESGGVVRAGGARRRCGQRSRQRSAGDRGGGRLWARKAASVSRNPAPHRIGALSRQAMGLWGQGRAQEPAPRLARVPNSRFARPRFASRVAEGASRRGREAGGAEVMTLVICAQNPDSALWF